MTAALVLSAYALVVAWSASVLLTPLTSRGINARLGLAAWLTAMASVLICLGTALVFLITAAVASWPGLAADMCRSVAGQACTPLMYRGVFEFGLSTVALVAAVTATVLAWRYGCHVQRARQGTRAHAEAAHMTGRRLPGIPGPPGALGFQGESPVVLDSAQRVAYCVPGRPAVIVLSTGALAVLDPAQLTAVLAHERAHLAGRHHLLIAATRGLAATFPAMPLFTRGPAEVARLAEMRADDVAARRSGTNTLVTALLAMGTGLAVPAAALAASTCAVQARVQRLLEPPRRGRRVRSTVALAGITLLLASASAVIAVFASSL